jgi:hypothetical protein
LALVGQSIAADAAAAALPIDLHVQECSVHMALPANWSVKAEKKDSACVVTADEPAHPSRCGTADETEDGKVQCQPDHRIVVSIRPGSIEELKGSDNLADTPFEFEQGKWRYKDAWLSEHDAKVLQAPRKILYADFATRDYYQDGTYCCVGREWWALVDLSAHRVAQVEWSWDGISWDNDTTGWDDATDAAAKKNVEQFLRALH